MYRALFTKPEHAREHGDALIYAFMWPFRKLMPAGMRLWHDNLMTPSEPVPLPEPNMFDGCDLTALLQPVVMQGMPVTHELDTVFGFWGKVTGVAVMNDGSVVVSYADDLEQITFMPVFGKVPA